LRGVYTLIIRSTERRKVPVGKHLSVSFQRGLYLYTGSALGQGSSSLEGRIGRHLSREKKNFWHIDRVLSSDSAHVVSVIFAKTPSKAECKVNTALLRDSGIDALAKGIGSSDCRCESHFLMAKCTLGVLRQKVRSSYTGLGLRPHELEDHRNRQLFRFTIESDRPKLSAIAARTRTR